MFFTHGKVGVIHVTNCHYKCILELFTVFNRKYSKM